MLGWVSLFAFGTCGAWVPGDQVSFVRSQITKTSHNSGLLKHVDACLYTRVRGEFCFFIRGNSFPRALKSSGCLLTSSEGRIDPI